MDFLKFLKEQDETLDEQVLNEGVYDKGIFKAIFLTGATGSGKDHVLRNTLEGHGLVEINSDKALEYLMDREKLEQRMPKSENAVREHIRRNAKSLTDLRQRLAIHGNNGLILNGTGDNHKRTKELKDKLESLGYQTSMLHVNVDDETSKQRNIARGIRGGRTVPEKIRAQKWRDVQNSRVEHAKMFGNNYVEYDNNHDNKTAPPEVLEQKKQELQNIFNNTRKFVESPISKSAQQWVAGELQKKDRFPVPKKGSEEQPHPEYSNDEKAQKLGLTYYGMGRYGSEGNVTHRTINGKLVEVPKPKIEAPQQPKKSSVKPKDVQLTIKQKAELQNTRKLASRKLGESYEFSDSNEYLTLGSTVTATDSPYADYIVTNDDILNQIKLRGNKDVKKITNENQDMVEQPKLLSESTRSSATTTSQESQQEEVLPQKKATFSQYINYKESIDKGIEIGMGLNSYAKEKLDKTGKITMTGKNKISDVKEENINELTGDETTASISSQKEDELAKTGITLSKFKSKRVI
jgi:chloramphenicol 3-O-phosphotransferase